MTKKKDQDTAEVIDFSVVVETLDNAKEAAPVAAASDPARTAGAGAPQSQTKEAKGNGVALDLGLPPDCPVTPLGKGPGKCYYLDQLNQLMELPAKSHSRLDLMDLFGTKSYLLEQHWPRHDRKGNVTGWAPEDTAQALMAAAGRRGVWNPLEKVRGLGAWLGEDGELILHCGDVVFTAEGGREPGLIGRFVYPAAEAGPRPSLEPAPDGEGGAAAWLLSLLKTWVWRRPEIDPALLLGWITASMIGGALAWRPATWITGGHGTGKSTLHDVLKGIHASGLVQVSDTTAAGIWQKLGYATLPVAIDELEASDDNRQSQRVINLARQAASGGVVLRGGQDHTGVEFIARSCFLFSSIIVPPMEPQDLSRMAILELDELAAGSALKLDAAELGRCGASLRRRMQDRWADLPHSLQVFREALMAVGHNARGADQFGTLLACADLALHDEAPGEKYARRLADTLNARELNEWADHVSDERGMVQFLLTSIVDPYRSGGRRTIGDWIEQAAGRGATIDATEANQALSTFGLKVESGDDGEWLVIANQHQGLAGLFANTKWAGKPGRPGGWMQSARRIKGHKVPKNPKWIGGGVCRVTLIPLDVVLPKMADPAVAIEDKGGGDDEIPF